MLKVTWDSNVCSHAGICVGTLPDVFSVTENGLQADTSAASEEKIIAVCAACPSGALKAEEA